VIVLTGSRLPRDIQAPGRELDGICFAMEFLSRQNRRFAGDELPDDAPFFAEGKRVTVIGGGETGEYCVETCRRQGATEIVQLDIAPEPEPGEERLTWPFASPDPASPARADDGCIRIRGVRVREFTGSGGAVSGLAGIRRGRPARRAPRGPAGNSGWRLLSGRRPGHSRPGLHARRARAAGPQSLP
jgi:NADPH-dependent glutamate synthase beta subunit-like oxidoreductase